MRLDRLREWRERRALTQEELAKAAGLTQVTVSRLESGLHEPKAGTVRKLATALRLEPDQLTRQYDGPQRTTARGPRKEGRGEP